MWVGTGDATAQPSATDARAAYRRSSVRLFRLPTEGEGQVGRLAFSDCPTDAGAGRRRGGGMQENNRSTRRSPPPAMWAARGTGEEAVLHSLRWQRCCQSCGP